MGSEVKSCVVSLCCPFVVRKSRAALATLCCRPAAMHAMRCDGWTTAEREWTKVRMYLVAHKLKPRGVRLAM